jgi:hypothetical protein
MKRIFEHIRAHSAAFERQPLFSHLRDERLPPLRRLAFVPYMAHFVMAFADLYNFVLPVDPPGDEYDELVNTHLAEDSTHWRWFLVDLAQADMDPRLRLTDALRLVWSEDTLQTRLLSYRICQISGGMRSIERFVLISCIEATGRIALEALAVAGGALEKGLHRRLVYFGPHHVDTESSHAVETPAVRNALEERVLDADEASRLCALVDEVFPLFERSVAEMHRNAAAGKNLGSFLQTRRAEPSESTAPEEA